MYNRQVPVPTDEAVKEAENRLLGVETNITNWQRRQNANNNFSATVPYDMEPVSYTHLDVYKRQRMDRYSAANTLLIYSQYPQATQLK